MKKFLKLFVFFAFVAFLFSGLKMTNAQISGGISPGTFWNEVGGKLVTVPPGIPCPGCLPVQATHSGAFLTTDGLSSSWATALAGPLAIGASIGGSTPTSILFVNSSNNLAQSSDLIWDDVLKNFTVNSLTAGVGDLFDANNSTNMTINDSLSTIDLKGLKHTDIGAVSYIPVAVPAIPPADTMTNSGTYTGSCATGSTTFTVTIDSTDPPSLLGYDTVTWTDGATTNTNVQIDGTAQAMTYGVSFTFPVNTGHTLGDSWTFTSTANCGRMANLDGASNILTVGDIDSVGNGTTLSLNDILNTGLFAGKQFKFGNTAIPTADGYATNPLVVVTKQNDFSAIVSSNQRHGSLASADFVASNDADDGTNATGHYMDMGIASSGFTDTTYPALGSANDGYMYINRGNLAIGTGDTVGGSLNFFVSGFAANNIYETINQTGIQMKNFASSLTGNTYLSVSGKIGNTSGVSSAINISNTGSTSAAGGYDGILSDFAGNMVGAGDKNLINLKYHNLTAFKVDFAGNLSLPSSGSGLSLKEGGAAACMGRAVLGSTGPGMVNIVTQCVQTQSEIFLTTNIPGGAVGTPYVSARAASSFTISSTSVPDTSTVSWIIINQAP